MVSPVPKHLRSEDEHASIPCRLLDHRTNLTVKRSNGVAIPGAGKHRAKYAPGLATSLVQIAGTREVADPMCGIGTLAWETGINAPMNDLDQAMRPFLDPLVERGCWVTYRPADQIDWKAHTLIFSPPYYPRTDRRKPNAHDDEKRGPVVGFRDSYACDHESFVGNPGGVNAILQYRRQMTAIYAHLRSCGSIMITVTKNWTRLGVELRLDLDTILMAQAGGWQCVERHGWVPPPSLWAKFNTERGGGVGIEDVLIFA